METYEKAYKAVLQTAKQWIKDGCSDKEKICLECVFPELRESEDERIRKEIISFFRSPFIKENLTDEKVAPWLDWLEKQKYDRMKPVYDARESFESALEKAWNDYHNGYENVDKLEDDYVECAHAKGFREGYLFGIEKQKEQKHPNGCFTCDEYKKGYEEGRRNGFTAGYNKAMKEVEQKEQKPAEKQDYSGLTDLERAIHRGFLVAGVENVPVTIIKETAQDCLAQMKPAWSEDERIRKELIFFLKEEIPQCSIKEHADKLNEFVAWLEKQKDTSQEREQEDEKMLDSVIRIITQFDDLAHEPTFAGPKWTHPYTKELAWLKSICPQPKREWSEEDERIINALILELKTNPSVATTNGYKRADYIDWINNLRPSWKPSEEHLSALLAIINDPNNIGSQTCQLALTDLYEHLKRL